LAQEFFINSQNLQDKVASLLPSQGGAGAGFDLTASTQIIPIVDLTESAEGSDVRPDLQTALSFSGITSHAVRNATTTIVTNTGYFRVFGNCTQDGSNICSYQLDDGATTKTIWASVPQINGQVSFMFDFIVFLKAGDSLIAKSTSAKGDLAGSTRQIADIDGNLINP